MERFVRITAPTSKLNFIVKLVFFMLIGGGFNHIRHVLTHGFPGHKSYWANFAEAAFTTLPMCSFALLLIGHLAMLQRRLYVQAMEDPLTGLANRRWFMENTPATLSAGQILMIVDIDRFKSINDTFGHRVGDLCLQKMSVNLRTCLGTLGTATRVGGEEFAVFFADADLNAVQDIATSISAGFDFDAGHGGVKRITSSVGIAVLETDQARDVAFGRADLAVYDAKAAGRARFVMVKVASASD